MIASVDTHVAMSAVRNMCDEHGTLTRRIRKMAPEANNLEEALCALEHLAIKNPVALTSAIICRRELLSMLTPATIVPPPGEKEEISND